MTTNHNNAVQSNLEGIKTTPAAFEQASKATADGNNSSKIVLQSIATSSETAAGSGDLTRKATNKLRVAMPSVAGHPDEQLPCHEPVDCGKGIGDIDSILELAHWHRNQAYIVSGSIDMDLGTIEKDFNEVIDGVKDTLITQRDLLAKILDVDLTNGEDAEVDTEFAKNAFGLCDDEIPERSEHSLANPDEPYPFPQPINCSKGSGKQFFPFVELQRWHQHRFETVVAEARAAFHETKETVIAAAYELDFACIGRKAILERLLNIDLTDRYEDDEDGYRYEEYEEVS